MPPKTLWAFCTKWFLIISLQCLSYFDTEFHLLIKHNWASFPEGWTKPVLWSYSKAGFSLGQSVCRVCFQALRGWMLQQDNWGSVGQFHSPRAPWKGLSSAWSPCSLTLEYKACTSTPTSARRVQLAPYQLCHFPQHWPFFYWAGLKPQLRYPGTRAGVLFCCVLF